jgi:hypothetical protein
VAPGLVAVGAPTLRAIRATTPAPPAPRLAIAHRSRTTVMAGEPEILPSCEPSPVSRSSWRRSDPGCGCAWRQRQLSLALAQTPLGGTLLWLLWRGRTTTGLQAFDVREHEARGEGLGPAGGASPAPPGGNTSYRPRAARARALVGERATRTPWRRLSAGSLVRLTGANCRRERTRLPVCRCVTCGRQTVVFWA